MDKVSLLDVVPVHAEKVWVEPAEDGCLTLVYHRFPKSWLRKWLSKWFSPQIHIPLERFGSEIWSRIDGKRTAEDIIREVALLHPKEENFPQRIALYLSKLHQDGLIRLIRYE